MAKPDIVLLVLQSVVRYLRGDSLWGNNIYPVVAPPAAHKPSKLDLWLVAQVISVVTGPNVTNRQISTTLLRVVALSENWAKAEQAAAKILLKLQDRGTNDGRVTMPLSGGDSFVDISDWDILSITPERAIHINPQGQISESDNQYERGYLFDVQVLDTNTGV